MSSELRNFSLNLLRRFLSQAYDMGYEHAMQDRAPATSSHDYKKMIDDWLSKNKPTVSHVQLDPISSGQKTYIKGH